MDDINLHGDGRRERGPGAVRVFDLYLIHPPSDAPQKPIDPAHIVIGPGDFAGGGLTLAVLQVIRDTPDWPSATGGQASSSRRGAI
ncbi:hypothetical protein BD626DRAFT_562832 [Schizophyllum amplum]|uniref:Uncharacterized protein n=1 Tax=Schizophyllum amplum TaxID=97359 RepID=A0A550CW50_9AGAR|nr:hypothetical protein BD626DRAFT_562832 [Auriculariopsis ampla]